MMRSLATCPQKKMRNVVSNAKMGITMITTVAIHEFCEMCNLNMDRTRGWFIVCMNHVLKYLRIILSEQKNMETQIIHVIVDYVVEPPGAMQVHQCNMTPVLYTPSVFVSCAR